MQIIFITNIPSILIKNLGRSRITTRFYLSSEKNQYSSEITKITKSNKVF